MQLLTLNVSILWYLMFQSNTKVTCIKQPLPLKGHIYFVFWLATQDRSHFTNSRMNINCCSVIWQRYAVKKFKHWGTGSNCSQLFVNLHSSSRFCPITLSFHRAECTLHEFKKKTTNWCWDSWRTSIPNKKRENNVIQNKEKNIRWYFLRDFAYHCHRFHTGSKRVLAGHLF